MRLAATCALLVVLGCVAEDEFATTAPPRSQSCGSPGGESSLLMEAGFLHGADRWQCEFPDSASMEPSIDGFRGTEKVIPGSRTIYKVDWSGTDSLEGRSIAVGVAGEMGFFRTSSHDFGPPMTVEFWVRPTAQERKWDLSIGIDDGTGLSNNPVLGPVAFLPLQVMPVQQGGLEFALGWSGPADLDLVIVDPEGEELNRLSSPTITGGTLDLASNTGCGDMDNNEHAVWAVGTAPEGSYQVRINQRSNCGHGESTEWWLTVLDHGGIYKWLGGTINADNVDPSTSGAGTEVLRFDYPEVAASGDDDGDDDAE